MELTGDIAIVTGGGRGIGAAICRAFAGAGARVVVADIDAAAAMTAAGGLPQPALAVETDVAAPESVAALAATVLERFGRIDILVNNAGICPLTAFDAITPDEWDRVLAVNLKGAFLCSQAVLPAMIAQGYGRIINISSVAGKMGGVLVGAHYAASKAGLLALTFCLARAGAPAGVTVNALAPATVETGLTRGWPDEQRAALARSFPVGRLGQPEDVAAAALFLASRQAGFITGEVLDVNGGFLMD